MRQETKIIMEKEIKITPPEGFEIDKERSTFDCIRFKPIEKKRWRDKKDVRIEGYYICGGDSIICYSDSYFNTPNNYNIFATKKQAKSALAMARISQIMANDERFGGVVTDEEWNDNRIVKHIIAREDDSITTKNYYYSCYYFLAFRTDTQRELFLKENEDLIKDYLMLD